MPPCASHASGDGTGIGAAGVEVVGAARGWYWTYGIVDRTQRGAVG